MSDSKKSSRSRRNRDPESGGETADRKAGKSKARSAGKKTASKATRKRTAKARRKKPAAGAAGGTRTDRQAAGGAAAARRPGADYGLGDMAQFMTEMVTTLTRNAMQMAGRSRAMPGRLADVLFLDPKSRQEFKPEYLQMLADAGKYVKDARSVAGMTVEDLGAALELKDRDLLKAVEAGTATLSFDLILRLASLLARHDPVPFVLRLARAYNPQAWQILENWGVGQIPLQLQREREFINIYRRHDEARQLSDDDFERILGFTDEAFKLALHFSQRDDDADA